MSGILSGPTVVHRLREQTTAADERRSAALVRLNLVLGGQVPATTSTDTLIAFFTGPGAPVRHLSSGRVGVVVSVIDTYKRRVRWTDGIVRPHLVASIEIGIDKKVAPSVWDHAAQVGPPAAV